MRPGRKFLEKCPFKRGQHGSSVYVLIAIVLVHKYAHESVVWSDRQSTYFPVVCLGRIPGLTYLSWEV